MATIFLALALLVALAWRGAALILLAPGLALLAAGLAGVPVLASYTQVFMPAAGQFIAAYFPLFLLGAVFGRLMEISGAAEGIGAATVRWLGARHAILAVVIACAVLTYGGVSLFVVAFTVYPLAASAFAAAGIAPRLIPGTIALGAFTFTMTALPGTPAIQNAIPMPYFGTTAFAAPGLGLIAALVMVLLGYGWLSARRRAAPAAAAAPPAPPGAAAPGMNPLLALLPIGIVLCLNFLLSRQVFPAADLSWLDQPQWGNVTPPAVIGTWSILLSLSVGCLAVFALRPRLLPALGRGLAEGAATALAPIFNTASLVGFGAIIAALPAFAELRDSVLALAPGQPLISLSIAVNILAGVTGSASGGMSIALETFGAHYLALGREAGISPEVLHRVTAVATGGLDALPHNGAVVTLLTICKCTHRESYLDIFVVAVLGPLIALSVIVMLAGVTG